jgi:mono/diheme cytochrome c family protein
MRLAMSAVLGVAIAQGQPPSAGRNPQQLFSERCAACHGEDASGSDRGPALARSRRLRTRPPSEIRDIIRGGTPAGMPAFRLARPEELPQACRERRARC